MTAGRGARTGEMSHAEAWDAIPWLVNGSLAPDEAACLRTHVGRCRACAAEVEEQTRLAAAVAAIARPGPEVAASWRAIEARLGPEPRPSPRLVDRLRGLGGRRLAGLSLGGGLAAAMLVVAAVSLPPAADYRTLTDAGTPAGETTVELRVRPAPGTDPGRARAALEAAGATGIDGPSASGLLRAHVPTDARDAVVARLRADPAFLVVAAD